jgi:uncharacterized RDD family membrane protein YckC
MIDTIVPVLPVATPAAAFRQRTAAMIIDLGLLAALHFAYFAVTAVLLFQNLPLDLPTLFRITISYAVFFLIAPCLLGLSYFTILHAVGGQTLGKLIVGIRVAAIEGGPLPVGRSFLRTVGYLLSALPLGAGFLWMVLDREQRCWHDRLAGSQVCPT